MRKPLKKLPFERNTTASSVVFSESQRFFCQKRPEMPEESQK
jgi:hypothetical protein